MLDGSPLPHTQEIALLVFDTRRKGFGLRRAVFPQGLRESNTGWLTGGGREIKMLDGGHDPIFQWQDLADLLPHSASTEASKSLSRSKTHYHVICNFS